MLLLNQIERGFTTAGSNHADSPKGQKRRKKAFGHQPAHAKANFSFQGSDQAYRGTLRLFFRCVVMAPKTQLHWF
jgi:hypothetical protein